MDAETDAQTKQWQNQEILLLDRTLEILQLTYFLLGSEK